MRIRLSLVQNSFVGASWFLLVACSGSTPNSGDQPSAASGGNNATTGQGGNTSVGNGGAAQVGGNQTTTSASTGGTTTSTGTGGVAPSNGGAVATGGATGAGGSPAAGGVTTSVGGATTTVGGATNRGGATTGVGGATSNGGNTARGGTTSTGGSTSTSTCVDTPRSSESCADAKAWGFCTQTWFSNCQVTCGTCSSGSGNGGAPSAGGATSTTVGGGSATGGAATTATGGSTGGASVPLLSNGTQGKTTRYWDCCKPSCGWKANAQAAGKSSPATSCAKDGSTTVGPDDKNACEGGPAYQCNWGAPWQAGPNLSYGYAAFNGSNCGKCYQLDFTGTGDNAGAKALAGKTMIVQAVNIGSIEANQFDLLIPGGGVGVMDACTKNNAQWGAGTGGAQYGGFLTTCGTNMSCITDMCKTAFGSNAALMAGCSWFVGWFGAANNPGIKYAEVSCPAELSSKSGLR